MQNKFTFNPLAANNNSKVRPLQSNLRPSSIPKSPFSNTPRISQSVVLDKKPLTLQKSNNVLNKSQFIPNGNLSKSQSQIGFSQFKVGPSKSPVNQAAPNFFNPPKSLDL